MNPFLMDPKARLGDWKDFRKSLADLPESEQINAVAAYWAKAPLQKIAYDIEDSQSIPSPWEMISEGVWCRNSVAIGMEFTLRLAGWDPSRLRLALLRDWDISAMVVILIIDESQVLNYSYEQVTNYPTTRHDVIGSWRFSGKFYAPVA